MELLNQHAHIKEKYVGANNARFMNKNLSKAVMTRSGLKYTSSNPCVTIYNKYRNYSTFQKRKEKY